MENKITILAPAARRAMLCGTALSLLGASPVCAQQLAEAQPGDIIVTAQKRAERLIDVPVAISALSGEEIANRGIDSFEALSRAAPSLSFQQSAPGEFRLSIRGLTTDYLLSPTVALYVDETPLDFRTDAYSGTSGLELFDVARVEVLRGPQGTLYGSSSLGGTVRIVSNQPNPAVTEGKVELGINSVDGGDMGMSGKAMANVPLGETVALRLVAAHQRFGGYVDRVAPSDYLALSPNDPVVDKNFNESDISSIKATLGFYPTDNLKIVPSFFYQKILARGRNAYSANRGAYELNQTVPERFDTDVYVGNLLIENDFGGVTLTSSTSYLKKEQDALTDFSGFFATLYTAFTGITDSSPLFVTENYSPVSYKSYVQEVRLASSGDGPFNWIIGGYYNKTKQRVGEVIIDPAFDAFVADLFGLPGPTGDVLTYDAPNSDTQKAAFADVTYNLTEALSVSAGLRYYHFTQTLESTQTGILAGASQPFRKTKEDGFNPRFNVSFMPNDDLNIYASASRGFRQGGPNGALIGGGIGCPLVELYNASYESDSVWNYEVGTKASLLDRRLNISIAGYHLDWKNLQLGVSPPGGCGLFTVNAGSARVRGLELDFNLKPTDMISFYGSLAHTDATFRSVLPGIEQGLGIMRGDRVKSVPKWQFNLGGEVATPVSEATELFGRGEVQYTGSAPANYANAAIQRPAITNVNASVGVRRDGWEVSLYARNLLNDVQTVDVFQLAGRYFVTSPPRTIGLTLRAEIR